MVVSANRLELLQIADAVAREKSIDKSIVIAAMADAIQKAARSRYGTESNIKADINPKTGEMKLQRLLEVVEHAEDYSKEIPLLLARDQTGMAFNQPYDAPGGETMGQPGVSLGANAPFNITIHDDGLGRGVAHPHRAGAVGGDRADLDPAALPGAHG